MSELRKDSLSFFEALGQSVANVSPTLTPALAVAVVAGMAGTASWLVYVIATVALVIVALNISKLAGRIPAAGSYFIYISRSLGPSYGMLAGWAMLAAYIFTAMALTVSTSLFIKTFFSSCGFNFAPPNFVLYIVISLAIWLFATRDIRMSSRIGLTLEVISVVIIAAVVVVTLSHYSFQPDMKQITLQGSSFSAIAQAIVFAIFSFVGFESAASLGKETRNPQVTIPKAILATAIFSGFFFVITTYVITQGFNDDATKLGNSAAPLGDITNAIGPWMTAPVYFGATISSFACALASLNAFGRMLFSLGRYQFVHSSMGIVHDKAKTPFIALTFGAILNVIVCCAFSGHANETDPFGWYGTLASFGFIIVYLLVSVSAPFFLKKTGELKAGDIIIGGLGAVLMFLSLVGSVYPAPAAPYNYFPYAFAAYMLIGAAWFFIIKAKNPRVLDGIAHDLESTVLPNMK
ncbi:MAG TPA: APC family permease [Acidocella sp.]|nr:APC family permease [Acidocella sp.]HQU03689.1 APC family permease [Acidocella sp.]